MLNADQAFTDRPMSLSSSYNQIHLGDETVRIPAASLFLRAHHLDRHMREQPIDGPLLTTSSGERLSAVGVQQQLRVALQKPAQARRPHHARVGSRQTHQEATHLATDG